MLETVKIRKMGYAIHTLFGDFVHKYSLLLPRNVRTDFARSRYDFGCYTVSRCKVPRSPIFSTNCELLDALQSLCAGLVGVRENEALLA